MWVEVWGDRSKKWGDRDGDGATSHHMTRQDGIRMASGWHQDSRTGRHLHSGMGTPQAAAYRFPDPSTSGPCPSASGLCLSVSNPSCKIGDDREGDQESKEIKPGQRINFGDLFLHPAI